MSRAGIAVLSLVWLALAIWFAVRGSETVWVVGSLVTANLYAVGGSMLYRLERRP